MNTSTSSEQPQMNEKNPAVDEYFVKGCGRCSLYDTPQCRVHPWKQEMEALREWVLESVLVEEIKWSMPCYTLGKANVLMISAFRDYCAISFFKGALLSDANQLLTAHGENSQAARTIRFTSLDQIRNQEVAVRSYIAEAIAIEQSGQKVNFKPVSDQAVPEEFQKILDQRADVKDAFQALTPGRQRAYLLFFAGAKQAKTREARIEKCLPQILAGIGLYD